MAAPQLLPPEVGAYTPDFLDAGEAEALQAFCDTLTFKAYTFARTNKPLHRSPKCEFAAAPDLIYRWGQSTAEYRNARPMPDELCAIAARLPEPTNHVVVIRYTDGERHHQPDHRDKQDFGHGTPPGFHDIARGSSIFVVSVGAPRRFRITPFPPQGRRPVWEHPLAHGSLLQMTAHGNEHHVHAVPPDPLWPGPVRYSLVFRSIVGGKPPTPPCR